jgi:hypothetical protein
MNSQSTTPTAASDLERERVVAPGLIERFCRRELRQRLVDLAEDRRRDAGRCRGVTGQGPGRTQGRGATRPVRISSQACSAN